MNRFVDAQRRYSNPRERWCALHRKWYSMTLSDATRLIEHEGSEMLRSLLQGYLQRYGGTGHRGRGR